MRKVAKQGSGSTKVETFIKGLKIERTEKMSKHVEDTENHVSHCQRKKLQTYKGKQEELE